MAGPLHQGIEVPFQVHIEGISGGHEKECPEQGETDQPLVQRPRRQEKTGAGRCQDERSDPRLDQTHQIGSHQTPLARCG